MGWSNYAYFTKNVTIIGMGILVEDSEERSKLQDRISADLRERASRSSKNEGGKSVDLVEDSALIEGTRTSRGASWFWIILTVLAVILLGIFFFLHK